MGIYIEGLEMPKEGQLLYIDIYPDGKVAHDFDLECKQIAIAHQVPAHGRLVDAYALMGRIEHDTPLSSTFEKVVRRYIEDAPTIITAEEVSADGD